MLNNSKILIADDDEILCYLLKEELVNEGFQVDIVYDGKYAIERLKAKTYNAVLLDLEMKEVSGERVLKFVKENYPSTQVIILTAKSEVRVAVDCIKEGAYDFVTKPYEFASLLITLKRALEHKELLIKNELLSQKVKEHSPGKIVGESPQIKEVLHLASRAAQSDSSILLQGETGVGKEVFADFIHSSSRRSSKPLVTINCASLPDQLIESEVFGYEKGAFTDAKSSKQGLVEIADGGTLFLDEIGELSLGLQPKLLRFLENGEFRRVGGVTTLSSDVRVIGATNKNLMEEAELKSFRKDLLFRLNVVTLTIPPLRERGQDIILLARYFLEKKSPVRSPKKLSKETEEVLSRYDFPGNVRELQHIIERAIIFSDGGSISPRDLNLPRRGIQAEAAAFKEQSIEDMEKELILNTLKKHDWNREFSARTLGISLKTLYSKIIKYNLK